MAVQQQQIYRIQGHTAQFTADRNGHVQLGGGGWRVRQYIENKIQMSKNKTLQIMTKQKEIQKIIIIHNNMTDDMTPKAAITFVLWNVYTDNELFHKTINTTKHNNLS